MSRAKGRRGTGAGRGEAFGIISTCDGIGNPATNRLVLRDGSVKRATNDREAGQRPQGVGFFR